RVAVGTPPLELRGVPEPSPLHVVVADLDHALGSRWHEGEVLAGRPPALGAGDAVGVGDRAGPLAPWVAALAGDQRLELGEQLGAALGGEARGHADVLEGAAVVQPE